MDPIQPTRIMVLGHSFVWRLAKFLRETPLPCVSTNFHLTMAPIVQFHGVGGRTVPKLRQFDLFAVAAFEPTLLILEIGSNDLTDTHINIPDLAANIFQLVQFLHFNFSVDYLIVSQILPRITAPPLSPCYNVRVTQLNRSLFHLLKNVPFATFWFHFSLTRSRQNLFLPDGVHLNCLGNHLLYRSYQKALLRYFSSISFLKSNGRISLFRRPPCRLRRPRHFSRPQARRLRR